MGASRRGVGLWRLGRVLLGVGRELDSTAVRSAAPARRLPAVLLRAVAVRCSLAERTFGGWQLQMPAYPGVG